MRGRAIKSVPWTLATYAASTGLNVATTIALTHVLDPSAFGTVALGMVVVTAASILRDSGLGHAMIVRQDADAVVKGTVLSLTVGVGLVIGALLAACAPLVAALLADDDLSGVLAALAAIVALGGLANFYDLVLQRELEFKRRFVAHVLQAGTFAAVAVGLALAGAGVWALVLGQVGGLVASTVAFLALAPYRVTPRMDIGAARDMYRQGRGFLVQSLTSVTQQNVDYLIVGRMLGTAPLGIYSMSFRVSELPFMAVSDPVSRVTFPALARMRAAGEDTRRPFLDAAWAVTFVAAPLGVVISAAADPLTRVVFGEEWLPMIGVLSLLGVWGTVRPLQNQYGWYFNASALAGFAGRVVLAGLALLVPAIAVSADAGGIDAVAGVMVAHVCVVLAVFAGVARARLDLPLGRQLRTFAPLLVACGAAWLAARGVIAAIGPAEHPLAGLLAGAGLALVTYAATLSLVDRSAIARVRTVAGQLVARRSVGDPA